MLLTSEEVPSLVVLTREEVERVKAWYLAHLLAEENVVDDDQLYLKLLHQTAKRTTDSAA